MEWDEVVNIITFYTLIINLHLYNTKQAPLIKIKGALFYQRIHMHYETNINN